MRLTMARLLPMSLLTIAAGAIAQVTGNSSPDRQAAAVAPASATFIDTQGRESGKATLIQTSAGVLLFLEVKGLSPGEHALHLHKKGACDAPGKFESAGEHFEPRGHQHGFESMQGPHAGDMPNQFVGADGVLKAHVLNPNVTLGMGTATLFDPDGTAIIIHAKADDYKSQPAGNAGDRIACAVVKRQN